MPSIHAVVPRQLSNTWSLVTTGSGSSVGGPFGGADDVPRGASPSSGRVLDDAGAGGGVDGADGDGADGAVSGEDSALAQRAARISSLAARHFNRGLRAYFFALAALAWFLHPALFIAMIVYVLYVLHRREFRSKSLKALRSECDKG